MTRLALLMTAAVAATGCSTDTQPLPVLNLDRPSAAAFGCYGDLRVGGEGGEVVTSAQPMASCLAAEDERPEGQAGLDLPAVVGFVLQPSRGTVAVIDAATQQVADSDPLTPGKNSIPVGTLPVGIAADRSGCYMVTASAASCDLSALDVTSALDLDAAAKISHYPINGSVGGKPGTMRAKPRSLVAGPQETLVGEACPEQPSGLLYVAYPGCHTVAVVDAASGDIQAGIQFDQDGNATITDASFECPSECGDVSGTSSELRGGPGDAGPDGGTGDAGVPPDAGPPTIDDGPPRPSNVTIGPDGRLFIASENSSVVAIASLDPETGLPTEISRVQLDGAIGVTAMAVSEEVSKNGSPATPFVYAVATDRTVRVVDLRQLVECDTQVDPRFIHDVRDVTFLACMPVGDPRTPARRPGAISPGIHMPFEETPLDVAFAEVSTDTESQPRGPLVMEGTFAFVTTSRGTVYVVNVADQDYPGFESSTNPLDATLPLALAHQLRDLGRDREVEAQNCADTPAETLRWGPRLAQVPTRTFSTGRIAEEKLHLLPSLHQLECTAGGDSVPVPDLSFNAPPDVREVMFPDWKAVYAEQDWSVIYEGLLSLDGFANDIDGPSVRSGSVEVNLDDRREVSLIDPAGSFCQLGIEPFDSVQLIGCDPEQGDSQCGLGETCYVHPDATASVTSGICLPADKTDALSATCRDFLITRRLYSASEVTSDGVRLIPRKRVLRTTPIDGCTSDDECVKMAEVDRTLSDPAHPAALGDPPDDAPDHDWVCRPEPSRAPGPNKCVMACEGSTDCEDGHTCLAGYCYESTLPSPECVQAVQRYQVRASEAFVVHGSRDGYLHNRVRDPETGQCVADTEVPSLAPKSNPLMRGRIPMRPPACVGDGMTDLLPNPCTTELEQVEDVPVFTPQEDDCVGEEGDIERKVRPARVLRLQNPGLRLQLVDTATNGDLDCNGDRAGASEYPLFSAVYTGFELDFGIIGGLGPMAVPFTALPALPIRIQPAPDGRMWVMDQGDNSSGGAGRVFTFAPSAPLDSFAPTFIQ